MKNSILFRFVMAIAFVCLISLAAAAQDSGVGASGYTSIDYDETTNTVSAYSETDIDYDLAGNYQTSVQLTVTKSDGTAAASGSAQDNSNLGYAEVVLDFTGAAGETYRATGWHTAFVTLYDYYDYAPYETYYHDEYYLSYFEGQGIYEPWFHFFESPGYRQATIQIQFIKLGRTYDSVLTQTFNFRGSIQAQGLDIDYGKGKTNLGGGVFGNKNTISKAWAQDFPLTATEGEEYANTVFSKLLPAQQRKRAGALADAIAFIRRCGREENRGCDRGMDFQGTDGAHFDVVISKGTNLVPSTTARPQ